MRISLPILLLALCLLSAGGAGSQINSEKAVRPTGPSIAVSKDDYAIFNTVLESIRVNPEFQEVWKKARLVDQTAREERIGFGVMKNDNTTVQGHPVPKAAESISTACVMKELDEPGFSNR